MISSTWRLVTGAARLSGRAGVRAARVGAGQVEAAQLGRRRQAAAGVLAPGDGPPPPGWGGVLDYRGLARTADLRHAADGEVPLGRVLDVRRGPAFAVGQSRSAMGRHAAVVGATGSGKTESVIVPWINAALGRGEHVVTVDVTGDLLEQVLGHQQAHTRVDANVVRWDFTQPHRSSAWNWLLDIDTEDGFAAAAEALVGRERADDPQPYFGQRDRRVLAALLQATRILQPSSPQSELLTLAARDQTTMRTVAERLPETLRHRLAEATSAEDWDYPRLMSGVVNALDFLDHSGVAKVTSRDDFRISRLLASPIPTLVIVAAPLSAGPIGVSTSSLMLALLKRQLYRRFGQDSGLVVNLLVDEAARLQDRLDLEELLAVSRRAGVAVTIALQTVDQLREEATRRSVLDNCGTFVLLPSSSAGSAQHFQQRLGEHQVDVVGASRDLPSWGRAGGRSVVRGTETRPVLGVRELTATPWPGRTAFVHAPALTGRPFAVDLTRPDLV